MTSRAIRQLAGILAFVWAGAAWANQEYDWDSAKWDGIYEFTALARGIGLDVETANTLDWATIEPGDTVVILYPTNYVDPTHVSAFLRGGGRLLLGDDFGVADEAVERLSMIRAPHPRTPSTHHDGHLFAPHARPLEPTHPIANGIAYVVCNHPAVLTHIKAATAVFGFSESEAVVAAGQILSGRFVVVSDPSMFINRMLEFDGNLRLAHNILAHLSAGGSGRVVLVRGNFPTRGQPPPAPEPEHADILDRASGSLNELLESVNDYVLTPSGLAVVGTLALAFMLLMVLRALPRKSRGQLNGSWTRLAADDDADSFHALVNLYSQARDRDDFGLPAGVVRDRLERQLVLTTGVADPLSPEHHEQVFRAVGGAFGQEVAQAAKAVIVKAAPLAPAIVQRAGHARHTITLRKFESLSRDVDHICSILRTKLA